MSDQKKYLAIVLLSGSQAFWTGNIKRIGNCRLRETNKSVKLFSVKPVYNDHTWVPKIVAWLTNGSCSELPLCYESSKWDLKNDGCYRQVVIISGFTDFSNPLTQKYHGVVDFAWIAFQIILQVLKFQKYFQWRLDGLQVPAVEKHSSNWHNSTNLG